MRRNRRWNRTKFRILRVYLPHFRKRVARRAELRHLYVRYIPKRGLPVKTKLLAAMIVVFMLHSVASAQEDYYIRTDSRINLRATYSLEGEKVETVPEGTTLHVVGRFNRWLKIDRNGDVLWLADWVYYTRVDNGGGQESSQTQEQSPSQSPQIVDNCCFVDRQCNTEQEWTSGYWAFQNNQCKRPGVVIAGVVIEGPEAFVLRIQEALDMLKIRAPEWYAYATSGLDKIILIPEKNRSGVRLDTRRWGMPLKRAFPGSSNESAVISLVGGMVHEACHVHRWEAGLREEDWRNELPCVQMQLEATEAVDPIDRFSPWLRNLIANIENPDYWWWTD